MENIIKNWKKILEEAESEMMPASFNTWVEPLVPKSIDTDAGIFTLVTYNDMSKSILQNRYLSILENAVQKVCGTPLKINFVLSDDEDNLKNGKNSEKKPAVKNPANDELCLNPRYNFSTFVVGANNELAYAAALAVAKSPATTYNPLFLYGKSGLGKTHLMHAVGHYVIQNSPSKRVLYVSSEMFTNELVNAIQNKKNEEFRNKYRGIDLLMIDDIQFIEKKDRTQEELFHTFETLYGTNKQIIFCSDRPPKEIETIDARLKSRFEWGLIADISSPDYETRMAILRKKEELDGYNIDDEVIRYIATNIKSNIRELEGALNKLVALSNLEKREINISMAEEVLKDIISPNQKREVTPQVILDVVAEHYGISVSDIIGGKRNAEIVTPRQVVMYLCREITDTPYKAIGILLGNRDHSTIINGDGKVRKQIQANDGSLKNNMDIIRKKLSS